MIREKDWRVYAKRADFNEIAGRLGISPVMARVLVNRDLDTYEKQDRISALLGIKFPSSNSITAVP